jgi:pyruvate dehydrogenase kinase 2/3/4
VQWLIRSVVDFEDRIAEKMRLSVSLLRFSGRLLERLEHYGRYNPSPLTIQHFVDFGKQNVDPHKSFAFLRKEIPVRLANIMNEINLLPDILVQMPSVQQVTGWYEQSFEEVLEFEDVDENNLSIINRFTQQLDHIQRRHMTVVETMARGVMEMKEQAATDVTLHNIEDRVQYFLDRFYLMRISIRMLIHQHLLLYGEASDETRHIGCFDPACDVLSVAQDAYENARFLCEQYYGYSPVCHFQCQSPFASSSDPPNITMTYVPSHLYYLIFELMKNSLRAVVEFHSDKQSSLPPINMLICKGREDVSFKLSDQGGGVPRTEIERLFKYMYSTAPKPPSPDALVTTPLAGYGYGLPIARLYARYFNGDLTLNSVDGYGTDAMIYLKVFPKDATELLPIYNKTSTHHYAASKPAADWTESSSPSRS